MEKWVLPISIHAPARGATSPGMFLPCTFIFQSTPPQGGRPIDTIPCLRILYFNPRPRKGGDSKNRQIHSKSAYHFCLFLPYKAIYHLFYPIQAQMYRKFSGISGASPPGFLCVPAVRTGNFYRNKGAFMSTLSFTPMCSTLFL